MGDLAVKSIESNKARHTFLRHLLRDVEALDILLKKDMFEKRPIRIGAEQEMAVTALDFSPSNYSQSILDISEDPHLTSEIAQFNLELNLDPFELKGDCFTKTEHHLKNLLKATKTLAAKKDQKILLTGILPTINRNHLDISYMMPYRRYHLLSELMRAQRGSNFEINIQGLDELITNLDSVLFEACNTSFQMHLQIPADEFVEKFNWAQQIAGPVLSIMVNSPLLLGRALWQETRIALFRQSLDTRTAFNHLRDKEARVFFGNHWLQNSISMLFKEHIARFPQLLTRDVEEDSLDALADGRAPALRALRIHNGTVYNWNRPCYGRTNGVPHLRIENRYVPGGPTPVDEIANFAFWIGLMQGQPANLKEFYQTAPFVQAKDNFYRAARTGLQSVFNWFGRQWPAQRLILDELLPMAARGLEKMNVDAQDISKYLGIIEKRATKEITGAKWQLHNYTALKKSFGPDASLKILTRGMYDLQQTELPLHEWPLMIHNQYHVAPKGTNAICQIMNTDLFTIERSEPLDLVEAIMEWHQIRHLPVENEDGNLVGIVTANDVAKLKLIPGSEKYTVGDIMVTDLITVTRDSSIEDCVNLMKQYSIGCLPVIREKKLTGMITDTDLRSKGFWN